MVRGPPGRAAEFNLVRKPDVCAMPMSDSTRSGHIDQVNTLWNGDSLMTISYDPTIINEFAERLYARANTVAVSYTLWGIGIGLSTGYVVAGLLGEADRGRMPYEGLCILLLGGIAHSIGRERAFQLKLRAQMVLCHVAIEENTRVTVAAERAYA